MSNGYTPDTRQRLQKAVRHFARLHAFDLECPHCGAIYQIRRGSQSERSSNWDPWTARFTCTNKGCGRKYVLGILTWPIGQGGVGAARAVPEDQVPSPRQLAQLRKEGGGWWMADADAQKYARPKETNLTLETERLNQEGDDDDDD